MATAQPTPAVERSSKPTDTEHVLVARRCGIEGCQGGPRLWNIAAGQTERRGHLAMPRPHPSRPPTMSPSTATNGKPRAGNDLSLDRKGQPILPHLDDRRSPRRIRNRPSDPLHRPIRHRPRRHVPRSRHRPPMSSTQMSAMSAPHPTATRSARSSTMTSISSSSIEPKLEDLAS
jgi:hypothetical protein